MGTIARRAPCASRSACARSARSGHVHRQGAVQLLPVRAVPPQASSPSCRTTASWPIATASAPMSCSRSCTARGFGLVESPVPVEPRERGVFGMYTDGTWYELRADQPDARALRREWGGGTDGEASVRVADASEAPRRRRPSSGDSDAFACAASSPVDDLDVSILQTCILAPIFGIDDPRTDERITFVGGIRGTEELERAARARKACRSPCAPPASTSCSRWRTPGWSCRQSRRGSNPSSAAACSSTASQNSNGSAQSGAAPHHKRCAPTRRASRSSSERPCVSHSPQRGGVAEDVDVDMRCCGKHRRRHVILPSIDMRCCRDGRIKMRPRKVGRFRMAAGHRATRGTAEHYSPNSSLNRSCSMTSLSENTPSSYAKRMMLQLPGTPPRS